MTNKQERITALEARLQDGFEKIGAAMQAQIDVTNWERAWIELLREYEELSDELAAAPVVQAEMPLNVRQAEAA